jgi:hypothetical protein
MREKKEIENRRQNATITATQERWAWDWLCTQSILKGVCGTFVVSSRPTCGFIRPSAILFSTGKLKKTLLAEVIYTLGELQWLSSCF